MTGEEKNVLCIRCSDARSKVPSGYDNAWVHEIRKPGGVVNTHYRSVHTAQGVSLETLTRLLLENIEVMVKLKTPDEIMIISHNHCGATEALGYTPEDAQALHVAFGELLKRHYPDIKITVLHETHSACGHTHHGHQVIMELA